MTAIRCALLLIGSVFWVSVVTSAPLPAEIDESSGLTRSLHDSAHFWTHNDTHPIAAGDEDADAALFRIDRTGTLVSTIRLPNIQQRDFESIDSFVHHNQPMLLIADSGDNLLIWEDYRLLLIPEPEQLDAKQTAAPTHVLRYRFSDRQSRDVEAVAVDTTDEQIWLISKRPKPAELFTLNLNQLQPLDSADDTDQALTGANVQEAQRIGELGPLTPANAFRWLLDPLIGDEVNVVTGMDIHPDGAIMAVLTYAAVYFFQRNPDQSWADVLQRAPQANVPLPGIRQWEGISFAHNGSKVFVSREGSGPSGLITLDVPESLNPQPTQGAHRQ